VTDFLSPEWCDAINVRATMMNSPVISRTPGVTRAAPARQRRPARSATVSLNGGHLSVEPGQRGESDLTLSLQLADGHALISGGLDSASLIREGRLRVRGDLSRLVAVSSLLSALRPST
jgi:hypothetical protein